MARNASKSRRAIGKKSKTEEVSTEIVEQLPEALQELLRPGSVRTLDDVTDVSTMFTRLVAEEKLAVRLSKEVRLWTELMFSAVAAKNATPQNEVNVIGQLIQQAVVSDNALKQIDEVIDLETVAAPKVKIANG